MESRRSKGQGTGIREQKDTSLRLLQFFHDGDKHLAYFFREFGCRLANGNAAKSELFRNYELCLQFEI